MLKKNNYVLRNFGDKTAVILVGEDAVRLDEMILINPTGCQILNLFDDKISKKSLLELFLKAVGVTSEEIIKLAVFDFDKFINLCLDYKILLNVE